MGKMIRVVNQNLVIDFELNDGMAALELYERLPIKIDVQNYSTNEKIFVADPSLPTKNTPHAHAVVGTLAYFSPFKTVCMFYGDFGSYSGLYELGIAKSGKENIKKLSGEIVIERI